MARVLVTGSGGFLGANLVRALIERGDEVHAMVRPEGDTWRLTGLEEDITQHRVDFGDTQTVENLVATVAPDEVYHLAQYGGNRGEIDGKRIREVCIEGTARLYDACAKLSHVPTIVHTGSSSEYGSKTEAMHEDMVPEPNIEYGIAKLWATLYGEHLRREKGMSITTLRLFSLYGPFEAPTRLFPASILSFMRGTAPTLAAADTVRDFIYVADAVEALLLAHKKPAGIYNIGTGIETTLRAAVEEIESSVGVAYPLVWGGDGGRTGLELKSWKADTTRAETVLGWKAKTSLSDGIQKTVEWFNLHEELYGTR